MGRHAPAVRESCVLDQKHLWSLDAVVLLRLRKELFKGRARSTVRSYIIIPSIDFMMLPAPDIVISKGYYNSFIMVAISRYRIGSTDNVVQTHVSVAKTRTVLIPQPLEVRDLFGPALHLYKTHALGGGFKL